jgi:hypothetical protein
MIEEIDFHADFLDVIRSCRAGGADGFRAAAHRSAVFGLIDFFKRASLGFDSDHPQCDRSDKEGEREDSNSDQSIGEMAIFYVIDRKAA